ncbi:hypothetical protein [Anaeroselena agilis]|uniref:Uncharacterized protein n=1 Tax=Anaeroselena agilis TaxID=3063788 RepID=A0ABU3NWF7_9FIRM|nr:hypothetical protein [Selenomonadales bacterium 4137-cl]
MPNRIIKESICTSDNLDELSPEEERFFFRLIVNCDDYGRIDARPAILRSKCFPLKVDEIELVDVVQWVSSLCAQELCYVYLAHGRPYLQITTWKNHQQVRAAKSKYPDPHDPNSEVITLDIICNHLISSDDKCPRNRIRNRESKNVLLSMGDNTRSVDIVDKSKPEPTTEQAEPEAEGSVDVVDKSGGEPGSADFMAFWGVYPNRAHMTKAIEAYENAVAAGESPQALMLAARGYARHVRNKRLATADITEPDVFIAEGIWMVYAPVRRAVGGDGFG